jgi:hypothetical protein
VSDSAAARGMMCACLALARRRDPAGVASWGLSGEPRRPPRSVAARRERGGER